MGYNQAEETIPDISSLKHKEHHSAIYVSGSTAISALEHKV